MGDIKTEKGYYEQSIYGYSYNKDAIEVCLWGKHEETHFTGLGNVLYCQMEWKFEDNYDKLFKYRTNINSRNPVSIAFLQWLAPAIDVSSRFQRFFIDFLHRSKVF